MKPPLLEVSHVCHDYPVAGRRAPVRALDDVSLTLEAGTILGIVGESGSGKSTLARIVMALARPASGTVLFEGEDLFGLNARALARLRRGFQMVFQDPHGSLDPRQRIETIVAEPLFLLDDPPRGMARRERIVEVLEDVGLGRDDLARYPHEFSGGQRQRIALARALVTRPKLIVADEAVSALDMTVQAQVLALIGELRERQGMSVLFITHNIGVVDEIADKVGVMWNGRLVEAGPTSEVLNHPVHDYTRRLLGAELTLATVERRRRVPPQAGASQ